MCTVTRRGLGVFKERCVIEEQGVFLRENQVCLKSAVLLRNRHVYCNKERPWCV